MEIKVQKGQMWQDETGQQIPFNRVTKAEKMRESTSVKLAKTALSISEKLVDFKNACLTNCEEVVAAIMAENEIAENKKWKGNFSFFNFDRSIKVEGNVQETITFDDILMEGAKAKLLDALTQGMNAEDWAKDIVLEAFQTTAGKLDKNRVFGLKKYTSRITNKAIQAEWKQAMEMIDKATSRTFSKLYHSISLRNSQGEYEAINLNFSSIKV